MKISIIGAGNVGGTLGMLWAQKGHQITFGVRDVQSEKLLTLLSSIGKNVQAASMDEAILAGEVIVIATPANAIRQVLETGDWKGKIVIDTTNRLAPPEGSIGLEIAEALPTAHVVKAFNTLGANNFPNPNFQGIAASMLICGDNPQAKQAVATLTRELGFDVVDVGEMSFAPHLEALAKVWIAMARGGFGRDFAFKVLKR